MPERSAPFQIAAVVLLIMGACFTFFPSLIYIIVGIGVIHLTISGGAFLLTIGVLGVLAFVIGVASGIFVLRKRRLIFSFFGACLMLTVGGLMSVITWFAAGFYGMPIVMFSVMSLVFLAMARKGFSQKNRASRNEET